MRAGEALQIDIALLFQRHPSPMWVYDRSSLAFLQVNDAAVATYGYSAEEFRRMSLPDIRDPAEVTRLRQALTQDGQAYRRWGEWRHRTKDGRQLDVLIATYGVEFAGRPASLAVMTDITEQRQAARRLEESEQRLRQAQRLARMGDWLWYPGDPAAQPGGISQYSEEAAALFGVPPAVLAIGNDDYLARFVHPDDREKVASCLSNLVNPKHENYSLRYRILRADGETRMIQEIAENVYDPAGRLLFTRGTIQDVTELDLLEQQLRQAQRMEALGKLTGGVAHDFNNLLTVIMGNVETLCDSLAAERPDLAELGDEALGAAQRAADLTQRLLTLSRQTLLRSEALDLAALLRGLEPLLRRTLGEHLEVTVRLPADLAPVLADAGQLENAVINLAVNARDAMAAGGRLSLEARNVELSAAEAAALHEVRPGRYVMLAVSDTGAGMSRAVVERAFEPFFSTKGPGKGSGLGLSTVYGFVRQSGGYVSIDSQPGRGTTVRLYLPQAAAPAPAAVPSPAGPPAARGQGEAVLVVEDDAAIRQLAVAQLRKLGYRTLEAESGRAAEPLLRGPARIDLLLTDIVMPGGLGGLELAALALRLRPGLKYLLVSGYAEDAFAKAAPGGGRRHFLAKPFRQQDLARAVRAALDDQGGPA